MDLRTVKILFPSYHDKLLLVRLLLPDLLWLEHGAEIFPQVPSSVAGAQLDIPTPFSPLQCLLQD